MIQIAAEYPDVQLAFLANTLMAQIDRYHFDSRDGTVYIDANGEGHQPPVVQGTDLILELTTLGNISGVPNNLQNTQFAAQFRGLIDPETPQATATFTLLSDLVTVRMRVSAAATALMTERRGVWDMEATWLDADLADFRTRRIISGTYILSPEQTK